MIDFLPYQQRFNLIGKNKENIILIHNFINDDTNK